MTFINNVTCTKIIMNTKTTIENEGYDTFMIL